MRANFEEQSVIAFSSRFSYYLQHGAIRSGIPPDTNAGARGDELQLLLQDKEQGYGNKKAGHDFLLEEKIQQQPTSQPASQPAEAAACRLPPAHCPLPQRH